MPVPIGARVGHYEVTGLLGAGGMGEVYRGRDTRLDRSVALKILPKAFASDSERRARFAREAKTLAALNHPHIAQIHGFEESGDTSALVMELVDGEDLSERIRRGPIPYDEAIAIARQIADALAAAHDQGIIHRDLKPGNIKLRDDGTIKVLDFGLAKAVETGAAMQSGSASDTTNSPTITSPAMTLRGVILGTAAYMAPEQAKGRAVDKRADIWAFGCVLYEMLTGRRAFGGEDVSETMASVLKSDVDWTGVPRQARRLIGRCLDKDPRKRLQDIRDAWDLLDEAAPAGAPASTAWLPWLIAAVLFMTTAGLVVRELASPPPPLMSAQFQIEPPAGQEFDFSMSVSPDGRRLAFTTLDESRTTHLWVRDIDSIEARRLPGTEGAVGAFWSPDSRSIAFGVGRALMKVDLAGGAKQQIAESPGNVGGGGWNRDGVIVFGTFGVGPIRRVPAAGDETPVTLTPDATTSHSFPLFLPDGRRFLYFIMSARPDVRGIYLGAIDREPSAQERVRVVPATHGPIAIVNSSSGSRLLFVQDGSLKSQPFDTTEVRLTGEPTVIAEDLGSTGARAFVSVTDEVLAYRTGVAGQPNVAQLRWVDRTGASIGDLGEPRLIAPSPYGIAIAPGDRQAALMIAQTPSPDLWLMELARGVETRVTFHEAADMNPIWSPRGDRLAFRSNRVSTGELYEKDVSGTADETLVFKGGDAPAPTDWSNDGKFLLFQRLTANHGPDLWVLPVGRTQASPLLQTPFAEQGARFSPDGRWVAYTSTESGRPEIYLRPFNVSASGQPSLGQKARVSTDGGSGVRWRGDGRELIYRDRTEGFTAVDVTTVGTSVTIGIPRRLFAPPPGTVAWDITANAQRFLVAVPVTAPVASMDPITVVLNWQQQ
jgi:serine/threonine protein kinase/Tol biopolymer transport system component